MHYNQSLSLSSSLTVATSVQIVEVWRFFWADSFYG